MKKAVKWLIKLGITIGLFVLIFYPEAFGIRHSFVAVSLGGLFEEIRKIELYHFWPWILFAFLVKAGGMLSAMIRWNLLLKGQGIFLPFRHLAGTFLTGRFFGMFLPSTIGLDGYRLYDVARHTGKVVESTTVIAVEKLIGFIALTFLVFITLPLGASILNFKPLVLAAILVVLATFVVASFLLLMHHSLFRLLIGILPIPFRSKLESKIQKVSLAVTAYADQRTLLLKAVFWGIMVHLGTTLMYFGTAMAVRAENIQFADILFAAPLMIYGTVLGPSIGGEGIREIIFIALLGASAGTAITFLFSHLGFWVGQILSLAGGVIYLIRPPEYKPEMMLKDLEEIRTEQRSKEEVSQGEAEFQERLVKARQAAKEHLRPVLATGLWAGAVIGIVEAILVISGSSALEEIHVLWYGVLVYGPLALGVALVAALVGGLAAVVFQRDSATEKIFARYFSIALVVVSLPIARFRISRDLLHEQPLSLFQNLELVLGTLAALLLLAFVLGKIFKISRLKRLYMPLPAVLVFITMLLVCVIVAVALGPGKAVPAQGRGVPDELAKQPNIILIMVDTLRADYVSAYGYPKNLTPHLDRLAADGTRFDKMFAQASWTKPSAATMLTGLYPSTHKAVGKPDMLPDNIDTVAELVQAGGYMTGGVADNINVSPLFGFSQGFDDYVYLTPDHFFGASDSASKLLAYSVLRLIRARFFSGSIYPRHYYQEGRVVNQTSTDWLGKHADDRFFYYIHYMDPHDPYFEHPFNGVGIARVQTPSPDPKLAGRLSELYEGEVRYWDEKFGELVAFLKKESLYDNTLILVTADHGEEFYEHGGWWHGTTLYDEQVRVPLVVKWPKSYTGQVPVFEEIARMIDLAPTILEAAGVPIPSNLPGRSLINHEAIEEVSAFAEEDFEGNIVKMIRTTDWKLLTANPKNPRGLKEREVYHLAADPGETNDVADDKNNEQKQREMDELLNRFRAVAESAVYHKQQTELSDQDRARLQALGYLGEDESTDDKKPAGCGD